MSDHGSMRMPDDPARLDRRGASPMDGADGHAGMHGMADGTANGPEMAGMDMAPRATPAQTGAVAFATVLALVAALVFSARYANLTLSAAEVGGAVMPPGMVMTADTPGQSMVDMAAVDPGAVIYRAAPDAVGDQILEPRLYGDVKVFDLDVSVIEWSILPDERVMACAFNRQVPGPRIRVTEGDRVRINVTNDLPEATSVHWHGLIVPNGMDGPADITQAPIEPGQTFVYECTIRQRGTYFYHTHKEPDRQQALGMYGALIVDPADPAIDAALDYDIEYTIQLQEWLEKDGYTYPAMLMEGTLANFFAINGKAYPVTNTIRMEVGQKVRLRFIGSNNNFVPPMHVHGGPFEVVAIDGESVPEVARQMMDTVNVGPGQRYDVIWEAREPGTWLFHCHIPHHTTNNNVEEDGGGGLTMKIDIAPAGADSTTGGSAA